MNQAIETSSLEKISSQFQTIQLKFGVERRTDKFDTVPEEVPRVSLDMVESWTGEVVENGEENAQVSAGLVKFHAGDVCFSKLRPYLAKGFEAEHFGAGSSEFLVFRPTQFDARFLLYLLLSREFIDRVDASTYGAKMPRASWNFIGDLLVPCPDERKQTEIADFLDHRTARIEALVAKQKRLLDLLDEKREAFITQVVTKGLNPNAEMKSPDSKWLNEIPTNWEVLRLNHLRDSHIPIVYGIVLPGPNQEEGVPIIKGGDCKPEKLDPEKLSKTTSEIAANYQRSRLQAGELVYEIRGSVGRVVKIPPELEGANLTQDTARIAPKNDINEDWLIYALQSEIFRQQMDLHTRGATVEGVNLFDLRRGILPVPPLEEQNQIADHLEMGEEQIQNLRQRVEEAIDLLEEKRQALITAAVTGQIDVTGTHGEIHEQTT